MIKKFLLGLCVLILVFSVFASANARMFDLRTNKAPKGNGEIFFDNPPHLAKNGYSGIYVGDTVKISRISPEGKEFKIVFPSGKSVTLPIVDTTKNYFEVG
jgi:hypothetical protein